MLSRHPLLPAFFAFAAGVVLSRLADFSILEISIALAAYAAMACVSRLRAYGRLFHVNVAAAVLCAGILIGIWRRPGPPPEIDFEPGEIMLLAGCVVEPPSLFPDREQFVLELAAQARVRVQLYLSDGEPPPRLRYGQQIEVDARLRHPRNYRNPGAFDYQGTWPAVTSSGLPPLAMVPPSASPASSAVPVSSPLSSPSVRLRSTD